MGGADPKVNAANVGYHAQLLVCQTALHQRSSPQGLVRRGHMVHPNEQRARGSKHGRLSEGRQTDHQRTESGSFGRHGWTPHISHGCPKRQRLSPTRAALD